MSMDDPPTAETLYRRRPVPADPDEDELARHWSLTPVDLAVVAEWRGGDHRQAPVKIVNHLSRQLGLPPVLLPDRPGRAQTERAQGLRIRRHLGLRAFDSGVATDLRHWLRQGAVEGRTAAELPVRAEGKLRGWHVMLPAISTLDRLVTAEVTHATSPLYETASLRLPPSLREAIDLLVEAPEGDARSSLFRLKDAPGSASAATIKGDIVRLRLIERLVEAGAGLDDLDPRIVASSGAATTRATCAGSPSRSAMPWSPAIWSRPARRCAARSSR